MAQSLNLDKRSSGVRGQKLKLTWNILSNNDQITKEDVEPCKYWDLMHNTLV